MGGQAIRGFEGACAFALAVRERLGRMLKTHEIKSTRLFFYRPSALGSHALCPHNDPGVSRAARLELTTVTPITGDDQPFDPPWLSGSASLPQRDHV